MKKEDKKNKGKEPAHQLMNFWMITTAVLGIAFLVILVLFLQSGNITPSNTVSAETCGIQMITFINDNFVETGTKATFLSAADKDGMFEIKTSYQNNTISVFATQDCRLLFLSNPVDVLNTTPVPTTTTTPVPTLVKTAIPTVDLFVMSFCPYGVQAENSLEPVVNLLGGKANFTIQYITSVQGNTINNVSSLHGLNEAKEDARQLCVLQYNPDKYWTYVMQINDKCYPVSSNSTALETCWKEAASGLGIDISQIESCAYGSEGISLLRASEQQVDQYGVTGSPTLIINGQKYTGARSPEAFKTAICNSFQKVPAECSINLSANVTPASGSCG